jgi:hypothetical protein
MNDLDKLLSGVAGVCEATSFEQQCLWNHWHTRGKWLSEPFGLGITLGKIDNRSVCVALTISHYNDEKILFWYMTSEVCDYTMMNEWLKEKLPSAKKSDADNFHNLVN